MNRDLYDTYDSCVVCAESEGDARTIHPDDVEWTPTTDWSDELDDIEVTLLGTASPEIKRGVIVASFTAG